MYRENPIFSDWISRGPEWLAVLLRHKSYVLLFVGTAILSYALTRAYIALARRSGWFDRPGGRKDHARPTPTMGGLAVFAATFAGVAVALLLGNRVSQQLREHLVYILGAMACTTAMVLTGVIDDLRGLRPRVKLLAACVLALAAYLLGFQVQAVTVPGVGSVSLGPLSLVLSAAWIVGITHAVNLTDGLDGLAAGIGFLAAAANALVAIYLQNYYMAVMMILLAGALLGFLPWNFHPARVFLGDTGSLGLGMFLALCSLHSAQKAHTVVMILVPLCALGYPIFDTVVTVARRTLRGQPVFVADREHIHHRLVSAGYGAGGAALRIYVGSIALLALCLLLSSANHLVVGLGMAGVLALALFCVRVLGYLEWGGWVEQVRGRQASRLAHAAAALARLKIAAAEEPAQLVEGLGVLAAEIGIDALEVDHGGQTLRWARFARTDGRARRTLDLPAAGLTGRMELRNHGLDERFAGLWADACRQAAERAAEWTIAPKRPEAR
jgi:UDP-GlcNAc:undecaprenyl-phosphate GlcNAc-1-phosphate transferase